MQLVWLWQLAKFARKKVDPRHLENPKLLNAFRLAKQNESNMIELWEVYTDHNRSRLYRDLLSDQKTVTAYLLALSLIHI